MNYSKKKYIFFVLGLFLLLFVSSCKNEEDHSPCGRTDCSLTKTTYAENGIEQQIISQSYVIEGGKKLLSETYWDILVSNTSIRVTNRYDNQARLIETFTTNTFNGGSNNSKITYEYDTSIPERVIKSTSYGNNNDIVAYSLYSYETLDKPIRQDFYNLQDEIVAHKELEYDLNGNLIKESDYQRNILTSLTTFSDYTAEGEWKIKTYENLRGQGLGVEKTTKTFENCTLKSTLIETDGIFTSRSVNTIEGGLIASTQSFDSTGNQINNETTYEYDCN
ncbi:hypothetical protein WAF17_19960 [Bernardetia sp. ABR2-2B]|uniref:hypothetical protein n=1 Tax=Bernardetia sp. ABR2-2B TaxID=3127472 RepID=UPI0030CAFE0C